TSPAASAHSRRSRRWRSASWESWRSGAPWCSRPRTMRGWPASTSADLRRARRRSTTEWRSDVWKPPDPRSATKWISVSARRPARRPRRALGTPIRTAGRGRSPSACSRMHVARRAAGGASHADSFLSRTGMALGATIYTFDVDLADSDRAVFESMALRVARHPSETEEYLVARVLAYALEFTEGIEFSRGLADPDEPAILIRDLTGAIRSWIDIGTPDSARLHRASKAAPRVVVYTHKDPARFVASLAGERIHRVEALEL